MRNNQLQPRYSLSFTQKKTHKIRNRRIFTRLLLCVIEVVSAPENELSLRPRKWTSEISEAKVLI